MSSDAIKMALEEAYPNTDVKDWKRRSKKKSDGYTVREFEHSAFGRISTYETDDGKITVGGNPPTVVPQAPPASATTPPVSPVPTQAPAATQAVSPMAVAPEAPEAQSDSFVKMRFTGFPAHDNKTKAPAEVMERITPRLRAIKECSVKVGDRMSVPAGIPIYEISYRDGISKSLITQRGTTAKCSGFVTDLCQDWLLLADEHLCDDIIKHLDRPHDIHNIFGWVSQFYNENKAPDPKVPYNSPELIDALEAAKLNVEQKFANGFALVTWGENPIKGALVSDINVAAVQKVAAPKKKAVSLRNQMVVTSKWRFTEDVSVTRFEKNPEYFRLMGLRNRSTTSSDRLFYQKLIDSTEEKITVDCGVIPRGTILTVKDKIVSEQDYTFSPITSVGLVVPCKLNPDPKLKNARTFTPRTPDSGNYLISYRQIAEAVAPEDIPEKIVYALRDSVSGQFFGGWIVDNSVYPAIHTPRMVDVFSSAKKYKTSAAAKASIRDFTGYNDGLDSDAPYWVAGGPKKIDLPETWEMVEVDQTTATIKRIIEIQKWFANALRLRALTVSHGSIVRSLFEKVENKEGSKLDTLVIVQNFDSYTDGKGHTRAPCSFTDSGCGRVPAKLGMIHAAGQGIDGEKIRVKSSNSIGYACALSEAILFKMAINDPDLVVTIIDIDSLEEIVNDQ